MCAGVGDPCRRWCADTGVVNARFHLSALRLSKHHLRTALVIALFLLTFAVPAYAHDDDDRHRGGKAPEAPLALLLPAAGGLAAVGRGYLLRWRRKP